MTIGKRFFNFGATIEERHLYDVMHACNGKAYNVTVTAVSSPENASAEPTVRHRAKQSMRAWLASFIAQHKKFDTKMVRSAAIADGFQANSVYGALTAGLNSRLIKRTAPGEYETTGKVAKEVKRGRPSHATKAKPTTSMREQVLTILTEANGTPVPVGTIKEKLASEGFAVTGVSPLLTLLMGKKLIKRPEPKHYQITHKGETAAAPTANGQA